MIFTMHRFFIACCLGLLWASPWTWAAAAPATNNTDNDASTLQYFNGRVFRYSTYARIADPQAPKQVPPDQRYPALAQPARQA